MKHLFMNFLTLEPGYYEDGKFGIRIEDVLLVKEVKTPNNFGGVKFFGFENLTMVRAQNEFIYFSFIFSPCSALIQNL